MRIGIFGHYGNGNLGDEGIVEACVESSQRILGADEVRLFSIVPEDSAARHNLDCYPIRRGFMAAKAGTRLNANVSPCSTAIPEPPSLTSAGVSRLRAFLKQSENLRIAVKAIRTLLTAPGRLIAECRFLIRSYFALRHLDLMIIAGSNQFLDNFGGVWGFPYTLFKWSILCRIRGTKLVFLSVGAGPIDRRFSKMMVRFAVRLAHYHSYRDEASLHLIEGPNACLGGVVRPDLACNLQFPVVPIDYASSPTVVAINPMPVYGSYWFVQNKKRYLAYIAKLAELISFLDQAGTVVKLFPTQTRDLSAINDTVDVLREISPAAAQRAIIEVAATTQDVMRIIQSAHVVIPTRFHGAIFGVLAKRMVIGICYQGKAAAVLEAAGQGDYAFSLDQLQTSHLQDAFVRLTANREAALAAISRRSDEVRRSIEEQYREIARLFPQGVKCTSS